MAARSWQNRSAIIFAYYLRPGRMFWVNVHYGAIDERRAEVGEGTLGCHRPNSPGDMNTFNDSLHVVGFANARFFAARLFHESFAIAFPVPREDYGLSIPTPPEKLPVALAGSARWLRAPHVGRSSSLGTVF